MTSFLAHIWPAGLPDGHWLYLWTLHDKRSHWYQDLSQAQKRIEASATGDLYVGVGKAKGKATQRLSRALVAGIPDELKNPKPCRKMPASQADDTQRIPVAIARGTLQIGGAREFPTRLDTTRITS